MSGIPLVPLEHLGPDEFDQARSDLQQFPADMLILGVRALFRGTERIDTYVAASLRVLLLDDRLAARSSALPAALYDAWTELARREVERWPQRILANYLEWMSWHPAIHRRMAVARLVPQALSQAPTAADIVLRRLVADTIPTVRDAAESALAALMLHPSGLETCQLATSWAVARSPVQRRAIARALSGAPIIVGAPSALARLAHDDNREVRQIAIDALPVAD